MSAFCEPVTTTSAPQASVSSGTAPRLEIASTTESAPASPQTASSGSRSQTTPVDVSEWTRSTVSAPLSSSARRRSSGRGASPHAYASWTTSQPNARAIACQRSPNSPCETASTRCPGERRLTIADSKAPVPDDVNTSTSRSVRNTSRSRSWARPKTDAKSGERWWMTGSASAASTSGGTGVGPGVSSNCLRVTL